MNAQVQRFRPQGIDQLRLHDRSSTCPFKVTLLERQGIWDSPKKDPCGKHRTLSGDCKE